MVLDHLKIIHLVRDNVSVIKCVANPDCEHKYNSFKALSVHAKTCSKKIETRAKVSQIMKPIEDEKKDHSDFDGFVVPCIDVAEIYPIQTPLVYGKNETNHNIDEFLDTFSSKVIALGLNYKATDSIFKLCEELTENMKIFCSDSTSIVDVSNHMSTKFHSMNSKNKRDKFFSKNATFIEPEEKAIGLHWEMKKHSSSLYLPTQVQSKYQYVSITDTLISLFDKDDFRKVYLDYNSSDMMISNKSRKHICEPGRYRDFCCGNIFEKNDFFKTHPASIQIQLFIDGFEICNPLKSRANVHTQVGVYFTIRNLPHRFAYNSNNIHLVAMVYANDLKTEYTDYNNLWDEIVRDITHLETKGIILNSQITLKGNESDTKTILQSLFQ